MRKIYLYTHYWGSYGDLFRKYTVPSAYMSGNIIKLKEEYHVDWIICDDTCNLPLPNSFVETMDRCVKENAIMIIAMPDFMFGDYTLYNGVKLIDGKDGVCLAVAHPRVSMQGIEKEQIDFSALSNGRLVDIAVKNMHHCFKYAFDDKPVNMTWAGLSIRQIDSNMLAVIHNLATPLILQPKQEDVDFMRGKGHAEIDRSLIKHLQDRNRIKLCGSSDLCFFIELTDDSNTPSLKENLLNNDKGIGEENYWNREIVLWIR